MVGLGSSYLRSVPPTWRSPAFSSFSLVQRRLSVSIPLRGSKHADSARGSASRAFSSAHPADATKAGTLPSVDTWSSVATKNWHPPVTPNHAGHASRAVPRDTCG